MLPSWKACFFISAYCILVNVGFARAGNISLEIPTGMFLNPTAEVQPDNSFLAQGCWLHQEVEAGRVNGYAFFASYTFSTGTEIGQISKFVNPPRGEIRTAAGGFVRQRILKEKGFGPALAVGGTALDDTSNALSRRSVFGAASKTVTPPSARIPVRIHVGTKWEWREAPDESDTTVYGGVGVGVIKGLELIGEVNSKSKFDTENAPYAVGIQYSHNQKLGFSLAAVNAGSAENVGVYFGVGYPFTGY